MLRETVGSPLASDFSHMRFLGEIPILGVHCLNGMIVQEDTSLSFCQDGDSIQSQKSFISNLLQGEGISEVTERQSTLLIDIIREFWTEGLKP